MTLALLLLIVAAIVFAVDAWLHKSLVAAGLCLFMLSLIVSTGALHFIR
jgi:hypothetical protein